MVALKMIKRLFNVKVLCVILNLTLKNGYVEMRREKKTKRRELFHSWLFHVNVFIGIPTWEAKYSNPQHSVLVA